MHVLFSLSLLLLLLLLLSIIRTDKWNIGSRGTQRQRS
jgi:hypothetical protein